MKKISMFLLIFLLIGCVKKESLYDLKTNYVGDNSKVIKIVDSLEYNRKSIEIISKEKPYGLVINLKDGIDNSLYSNFDKFAKTFALIDNLDEIYLNSKGKEEVKVTREEVDNKLKSLKLAPTRELGASKANFNRFDNYK